MITIDDVLESIHSTIQCNNIKLDKETLDKTDEVFAKEIPKRIENINTKKRGVYRDNISHYVNKDVFDNLVLDYFAYANDNVELLDALRKNKIRFVSGSSMNLFVLDKNFSRHFKNSKFLELISNQCITLRNIFYDARSLTSEEKEKYLSECASILSSKPKLTIDSKDRNQFGEERILSRLLSYRNVKFFGINFIAASTIHQRRVLNDLGGNLDDEDLGRLLDIMKTHPSFETKIDLRSDVFKILSNEEIVNMSDKDAKIYDICFLKNLSFEDLCRVHHILQLNPDFVCDRSFIKHEIIKCIEDDSDIAFLSAEAKKKIGSIVPVISDNVYIYPYKKILKVVSRDKKRREKEERKALKAAKRHK